MNWWGNSAAVSSRGGSLSHHSFSDFVWFCSNQGPCLTLLPSNSSAAVYIMFYLRVWETIWKISSNSLHEFQWRHLECALCSICRTSPWDRSFCSHSPMFGTCPLLQTEMPGQTLCWLHQELFLLENGKITLRIKSSFWRDYTSCQICDMVQFQAHTK